jgi:hypothetical protein
MVKSDGLSLRHKLFTTRVAVYLASDASAHDFGSRAVWVHCAVLPSGASFWFLPHPHLIAYVLSLISTGPCINGDEAYSVSLTGMSTFT